MRNSLVRFGKRGIHRSVFPFFEGFGSMRQSNFMPANLETDEDVSSILKMPATLVPRQSDRYLKPPRYNFFRY